MVFVYVAILGVIIIAYGIMRSSKPKSNTGGLQSGQPDLEESLQEFMDELEKSNLELIDTVHQLQNELKRETDINRRRIEQLEQRIEDMGELALSVQQTEPAHLVLSGPYAQVAKLHSEGLPLPDIARQLGMGTGEVELAMRFALEGEAR